MSTLTILCQGVWSERLPPICPNTQKLSLSWFLQFALACGSRDTVAMFLSALIKKESRPVPWRAKALISYLAHCHEFKSCNQRFRKPNACLCVFACSVKETYAMFNILGDNPLARGNRITHNTRPYFLSLIFPCYGRTLGKLSFLLFLAHKPRGINWQGRLVWVNHRPVAIKYGMDVSVVLRHCQDWQEHQAIKKKKRQTIKTQANCIDKQTSVLFCCCVLSTQPGLIVCVMRVACPIGRALKTLMDICYNLNVALA